MNKILYLIPAFLLLGSCTIDAGIDYDVSDTKNIRFGVTFDELPGPPSRGIATDDANFNRTFKLWAGFENIGLNTNIRGEDVTVAADGKTALFWNEDSKRQFFYALHPITDAPELAVASDGKSATFTYTVPENASAQKDLMVAGSDPYYKQTVPLPFNHALTRITFDAKTARFASGSVVKLVKIEIKGLHDRGFGKFTGKEFSWTSKEKSVPTPVFTMDFSADPLILSSTDFKPLNPADLTDPIEPDNMFLLPHDANELKNATITVTVIVDNGEPEIYEYNPVKFSDFMVTGWSPGTWVNYRLTISPEPVEVIESNCYMIRNGDLTPLLIPVSQLKYAMIGRDGNGDPANNNAFLGRDWIKPEDFSKLKVQVLWTDLGNGTTGKFGSLDAVVNSVEFKLNGALTLEEFFGYSMIYVTPGKGKGNAGVILYLDKSNPANDTYDAEDEIKWSWHIWNSDYYPYDDNGTPNGMVTSDLELNNGTWMDRNLGAMGNKKVGQITDPQPFLGFMYQWGRKDPLPGSLNLNKEDGELFKTLYYSTSHCEFKQDLIENENNLSHSVMNPLLRYYNANSPGDWFTTVLIDKQNNNLWGGENTPDEFLHPGDKKSVYDPCPPGYSVPKRFDDFSALKNEVIYGEEEGWSYLESYGGYYPATGEIHYSSTEIINLGTSGIYWTRVRYNDAISYASAIRALSERAVVFTDGGFNRGQCHAVRCCVEDPPPSFMPRPIE